MAVKKFAAETSAISDAVDYVKECLEGYGVDRKKINTSMFLTEESVVTLLEHKREGETSFSVSVHKKMGNIGIRLILSGEAFDFSGTMDLGMPLDLDGADAEMENSIRNLVFRNYKDILHYKNARGQNTVFITVETSPHRSLLRTMGALVLAIAFGVLMRSFASKAVIDGLNGYLLTPVKTMFLNALKMMVGPVVFFSIVSCISDFTNLSELGKLGGRILLSYMFTTFAAIAVGFGAFFLLKPGNPALMASVTDAAAKTVETAANTRISMLDTLVNIVPSNLVRPFLEADMLQIIFIALLCGIAVGMIGEYSKPLKELFEACNLLFLKITTLIVSLIPLAVFCSMCSLVMTTGTQMLLSLLHVIAAFLLGLLGMILLYCLMVACVARLNPLIFLKKYVPVMLTIFSLGSSSAAMGINMEACDKKLGIAQKVYSFSIPLGSTINMDGTCVYLAVVGLFMARIYGIEITGSALLSMVFSIFVLSIGAPAIPGAGLICVSVLLVQIGVPVEAVSLIMGIDPILGMLRAMSNSTGDAAISLMAAKLENLLDEKIYEQ